MDNFRSFRSITKDMARLAGYRRPMICNDDDDDDERMNFNVA